MFSKILIANRGEIAVRVIQTAKKLGYRTVAVYSEADAGARHVLEADQSVCIGPAPVGQSYLVIDKIIEACKLSGADAVHPGYGFLSENTDFVAACEKENITFIGPPAAAVELMGSKRLSKIAMQEAGVPTIPGYEGADQSDEVLIAEAKKIGFPVMVKASAGGGGRGMRLVFEESELATQIVSARTEAENSFGSGELIIEKAVIEPHHVEIQVFADKHGNCVHLGERDCSVQRRHQKVVEESPSPVVNEALRAKMGSTAVDAAKSCNYVGAGTVEFLVDHNGDYYFLEMNTRLQVEHPVTEMVTGLDLVDWQIRVAAGETLPLEQGQVQFNGHSIEVRIYAEDPAQNFMPQTGPVLYWNTPEQEGVRFDHGIVQGNAISPFYDPMVAKVISYGSNRDDARRRLIAAVEDTSLLGVNTNKSFLAAILGHPVFAAGTASTAFIEKHFADDPSLSAVAPGLFELGLAAIITYVESGKAVSHSDQYMGWRTANRQPSHYSFSVADENYAVVLTTEDQKPNGLVYTVTVGDDIAVFSDVSISDNRCQYQLNRVNNSITFIRTDEAVYLDAARGNIRVADVTLAPPASEDAAGQGKVIAPLDGSVMTVNVKVGDRVEKDDVMVLLDAMKMEHQLRSDVNGTVTAVSVKGGDQVKIRQLLVEVQPDEE
ncbi:MAG: acetyl/propionyl/methylcrotonyl-CoA carboxylase subunit alpha [Pseudomonadales bacterium]|nr:acetyl/propionyl/methylcrotonyl-CoA carboxylase subunit alpha [Pseudomonadales bacterium]